MTEFEHDMDKGNEQWQKSDNEIVRTHQRIQKVPFARESFRQFRQSCLIRNYHQNNQRNPLPQTSKMCFGYVREYTECQHQTGFTLTSECSAGSRHGVCRDGHAEIAYIRVIDNPKFCPDCYRRAERNICDSFDEEIDGLKRRILKTEKSKSGFEPRGFKDELRRLDTLLRDLRQERKSELRAFRKDNKVWGDG